MLKKVETKESSMALVLRAAVYAAHAHRRQTRKGPQGHPYIEHPLMVAQTLAASGVEDPVVLAAALLHDTIEDCEKTKEEIAQVFGEEVAVLVAEVTDPEELRGDDNDMALKAQRKQAQVDKGPKYSEGACLIKLADKASNVRDIREHPPAWERDRKRAYLRWAEDVTRGFRFRPPALVANLEREIATTRAHLGID